MVGLKTRTRIRGLQASLALAGLILSGAASSGRAAIIDTVTAGGYVFTNFDPTLTGGAVGSNTNGISNTGQVVGTQVDVNNNSTFSNFSGFPAGLSSLNIGTGQIAFGINSARTVVGGNGNTAFVLPQGGMLQTLGIPGGALNAFGINDAGAIVGQYMSNGNTLGFVLPNAASASFIGLAAPNVIGAVNAQGINNNGLVVGFYVGNDGNQHGFERNVSGVGAGSVTGTQAVADPVIPPVAGEPGATFVFSQLLGVNNSGLVAGYYGDSTTSQHGFLYSATTGQYSFLDDPSVAFHNGVEVTQITGITNAGELAGFYTDANGIAHSFVACPVGTTCPPNTTTVPEPASLPLFATGLLGLGAVSLYRRRRAR